MAEGLILEKETVKKRPTGRRRDRMMLPKAEALTAPINVPFDDEFDEEEYLRQHPEVAEAIGDGHLPNALFHFRLFGTAPRATAEPSARPASLWQGAGEMLSDPEIALPMEASEPEATASRQVSGSVISGQRNLGPSSVDAVITSPTGATFITGWAADRHAPLDKISMHFESGPSREWPTKHLIRFRRTDAETALGLGPSRQLGFCGLLVDDNRMRAGSAKPRAVELTAADGSSAEFPVTPSLVSDVELRDVMLGYLSGIEFMGNKHVESFYALDDHLGQALIRHSQTITDTIVNGATFERFETSARRFKGSIIVCLYGKAEFQFVQNALFSAGAGADEYEYIYVSNSPELIEMLCKTAQISQRVYGLNVTVAMLPGNAGFGAANNIAAQYARSRRLMIINPDVFPMNRDWAARHNQAVEQLPAEQTKLFGPRLFYADGSLMHAGMYLDVDWGVSVADMEIRRRPMLRVEHYGKGAPREVDAFRGSRPVSAVSGAFMSMERSWFEHIGGFATDYIFAYYEDADLCLRSLDRGAVTWVHDLDFWHMEGKGSSTPQAHHQGAALVNRWRFTRQWHDWAVPELLGRVSPSVRPQLQVAL